MRIITLSVKIAMEEQSYERATWRTIPQNVRSGIRTQMDADVVEAQIVSQVKIPVADYYTPETGADYHQRNLWMHIANVELDRAPGCVHDAVPEDL